MNPQWFWQTNGATYGPLSTGELEELVLRQRVRDADSVRLEGTDDWLPAAEIRAMFGAAGGSAEDGTAASAALRLLGKVAEMQLRDASEQTAGGSRYRALIRRGPLAFAGLISLAPGLVAAIFARLWRLAASKVALAVVLVWLVGFLLKDVQFAETQTEEAIEQLATAWDQVQALQRRGAPPAEWSEFERDTLEWLEPTVAALGEAALRRESAFSFWSNSGFDKAQAQRNLISAAWVLKDILARESRPEGATNRATGIVRDRNGRPIPPLPPNVATAPPEKLFAERMNVARALLSGEISRAQTGSPAPAALDPVIVGALVVDSAVVLGAIVFWWRRRKRPAARQ